MTVKLLDPSLNGSGVYGQRRLLNLCEFKDRDKITVGGIDFEIITQSPSGCIAKAGDKLFTGVHCLKWPGEEQI